jgi:hypothetical protein
LGELRFGKWRKSNFAHVDVEYTYGQLYIYGTEVEILTPTTGMPSAAAGLSVIILWPRKKTASFLSLHFPSRKEIFGVTFKSAHLIFFIFFNYIGLKLRYFKLRQTERIYTQKAFLTKLEILDEI